MKIGIVGAETVGSTSSYALVMSGGGRDIVLVDLTLVGTAGILRSAINLLLVNSKPHGGYS
jgi:malate/lactate dehydrogenase